VAFPAGVDGAGTTRIQVLDADPADPAAPTVAELTAGDDVTPYFLAGSYQIGLTQNKVDDTRVSDETVRESFGRATFTLDNLQYVWEPQAAAASPTNLAYDAFTPGTTKTLVMRYGIASANAFAAAQKVEVYSATFGERVPLVPGVDEGSKHLIQQSVSLARLEETATVAA
jgi:hypothetical protein